MFIRLLHSFPILLCAFIASNLCFAQTPDLQQHAAAKAALETAAKVMADKADADVTTKAYVAVIAASESTSENRLEVAEAVYKALLAGFDKRFYGMQFGFEKTYASFNLGYWQSVFDAYPEAAIRGRLDRAKLESGPRAFADLQAYVTSHPLDATFDADFSRRKETTWTDVLTIAQARKSIQGLRLGFDFLAKHVDQSRDVSKFRNLIIEVTGKGLSLKDFYELARKAGACKIPAIESALPWEAHFQKNPKDTHLLNQYAGLSDTSWEALAPILIKRGDLIGIQTGYFRLVRETDRSPGAKAFLAHVVAYVDRANAKELAYLLKMGIRLEEQALSDAVLARGANAQDPALRAVSTSNEALRLKYGLGLPSTKSKIQALADQYDRETFQTPPVDRMASTYVQAPDSLTKKKQEISRMPAPSQQPPNKEDPILWQRLSTLNALLAQYPNDDTLYQLKAEALKSAGFFDEAILTLGEGLRRSYDPTRYYALRSRYWQAKGDHVIQAIADANHALNHPINGRIDTYTLRAFLSLSLLHKPRPDGILPADWEPLLASRLQLLEDADSGLLNYFDLHMKAIRFWDQVGDVVRGRAAVARFSKESNFRYKLVYEKKIRPLEEKWVKAMTTGLYYGLPKAPEPFGSALAKALKDLDVAAAHEAYESWRAAASRGVMPRLYAAAAFYDLGAGYFALAILDEADKLKPSAEERRLLSRVRALCHAEFGEIVAAANAQEASGDGALNSYWLLAFIDANQASVFARLSERAQLVLDATPHDPKRAIWAWLTYQQSTPADAVQTMRKTLDSTGALPASPPSSALGENPTEKRAEMLNDPEQQPLLSAMLDSMVATSTLDTAGWWQFAKLAESEGRSADAAFGAACLLLTDEVASNAKAAEAAKQLIRSYRDGAPKDDAVRRNPCDLSALAAAYEAAREKDDVFGAAQYLRRLWTAYGDRHLNLSEACNVATATADWELLLSISQTAFARDPSKVNLSWYHTALASAGYPKSADWIGRRVDDARLRIISDEIQAWAEMIDQKSTVSYTYLELGPRAALHKLLSVADQLVYSQKNSNSEFWRDNIPKVKDKLTKLLSNASVNQRRHVQFRVGETTADQYVKAFSDTEHRALAQLLVIAKKWKQSKKPELSGLSLTQVNAILYNRSHPPYLRVMAQRALVKAAIVSECRPLRATDALVLTEGTIGAGIQVRRGRLLETASAAHLLSALGGKNETERKAPKQANQPDVITHNVTFSIAPPPLLRLRLTPDLPTVTLVRLQSTNFVSNLQRYAQSALTPPADRAIQVFTTDMKAAGGDLNRRWDCYNKLNASLEALAGVYYLEPFPFGDNTFAALKPFMEQYPGDAYYALMKTKMFPKMKVTLLSEQTRKAVRAVAQGQVNAYNEHLGGRSTKKLNLREIHDLVMKHPPGSSMYGFVQKKLADGMSPEKLDSAIAAEKARQNAKVVTGPKKGKLKAGQIWISDAIKQFEEAMRRGNLSTAADRAYTLGGQYFVRWALRDPSARLDELIRAQGYATDNRDRANLSRQINALSHSNRRASGNYQSGVGYQSSGGSSWDSFNADMESRRKAGLKHQRDRDVQNRIFKSDVYYK